MAATTTRYVDEMSNGWMIPVVRMLTSKVRPLYLGWYCLRSLGDTQAQPQKEKVRVVAGCETQTVEVADLR
jgi:hypothetical protein